MNYGPASVPPEIYVNGIIEPKAGLVLNSQMVVAMDKTTYKPVAYTNTGPAGEFFFRVANSNALVVLCFDKTGSYAVSVVDNVTPAIKTFNQS